jgi:hypothetical protein
MIQLSLDFHTQKRHIYFLGPPWRTSKIWHEISSFLPFSGVTLAFLDPDLDPQNRWQKKETYISSGAYLWTNPAIEVTWTLYTYCSKCTKCTKATASRQLALYFFAQLSQMVRNETFTYRQFPVIVKKSGSNLAGCDLPFYMNPILYFFFYEAPPTAKDHIYNLTITRSRKC